MDNLHSSPVFVHSLFRAGSTYLFNVFRRSKSGYWCYQEPLNERLIEKAGRPGGLTTGIEGANEILRHPELEKPHTHEFHVVADELLLYFNQDLSYDLYFTHDKRLLANLNDYFSALIKGARGRPVLQCCRTTGRIQYLQEVFAGCHIFLWRNPWDQWWSYKKDHYFDSRNLFIAGARDLPVYLRVLKKELNIPEFINVNPAVKEAYFANRFLAPDACYKLFYTLWCHAMLEAEPQCEVSISIDTLSVSGSYREDILEKLERLGVGGLDFNDCAVPIAGYGKNDREFFLTAESHVHSLLMSHGVRSEQMDQILHLSREREKSIVNTSLPENFAIRDAMHAREYTRQAEAKLSEIQSLLFKERANAVARQQRG
jgi:hypothetical protein